MGREDGRTASGVRRSTLDRDRSSGTVLPMRLLLGAGLAFMGAFVAVFGVVALASPEAWVVFAAGATASAGGLFCGSGPRTLADDPHGKPTAEHMYRNPA